MGALASLVAVIPFAQSATTIHKWEYDEPGNNQSHWAEHYAECGNSHQSPIDVPMTIDTPDTCDNPLILDWHSQHQHFAVKNNGHSVVAIPMYIDGSGGSEVSEMQMLRQTNDTKTKLTNGFYDTYSSRINQVYCFDSMHFHWGIDNNFGSEHAINGKHYPLEAHLVHSSCDWDMTGDALGDYASGATAENYDDSNVLAVVGILFEVGAPNPVLEEILNDMIVGGIYKYNPEAGHKNVLQLYYTAFDLTDLLPENREYIGYEGSLTTPPCYETVRWHVMKHTMTVSQNQLDKFRMMTESADETDAQHPNWRQLQPLNDRTVYECKEDVEAEHVTKDAVSDDDDFIGELIGAEEIVSHSHEDTSVQSLVVMTQGSAVWMVVCIVFIILFGIALLAVAFLASFVWKNKRANGMRVGDDKDELESHMYLASKANYVSAGDDVLSKI